MKKAVLLLLILILCTQSGCLDARSLEEYGYVLGIGVDAGEAALYRLSFMIQKEGPSSDTTASGFEVVSTEADTLAEAIMIAESGLPYELNLSRTDLLLIAEEAAGTDLLSRFLLTDLSAEKVRANLDLLVVYGRTDDFMKGLQNDADPNTAKMQATMLELSRNAGSLPSANLALFMEGVRGGRFDPILPLGVMDEKIPLPEEDGGEETEPQEAAEELFIDMTGCYHARDSALSATFERNGGLRSSFAGAAVFSGERMVGFLNTLHTELLLMARGEYQRGMLKLTDGKGRLLSLKLFAKAPPKTEITLSAMPKVKVTVPLTCSLEMEDSLLKGLPPIGEEELEACAAEFLERELQRIFAACRARGADAFGFGREFSRKFLRISAWEEYRWRERYLGLEAEFLVDVDLVDRESTSLTE